jgi:hypothetical protein
MATPDMVPVDSSNIGRIGYDETSQELYVEWTDGRTYVYSAVPDTTHQELMTADSKGGYINREIKPNYDCRPA